jgi:hypothetical protein
MALVDRLREHFWNCPDCAQEFAELEQVQGALDLLVDSPEVPPKERMSVNAYASAARWRRSRNLWRAATCAAAASLLVLAAGITWMWARGDLWASSTGAQHPDLAPVASDWAPEIQRLIARLNEQDKRLQLVISELQSVERRQTSLLLQREKEHVELRKDVDLRSLQVAALQRDIDLIRRVLTHGNSLAQTGMR